MSHRCFVWLCLLPLAVVTAAFFLLPMARLVVTGAEGPQGLAGYLAILTEPECSCSVTASPAARC